MKNHRYGEDYHVATHSETESWDRDTVVTLEYFLKSGGRICTDFQCCDKWPNIDGRFEFVYNPNVSRKPEQTFVVQIKGTKNYTESNGVVTYSLTNLSFPDYIRNEISSDPGILFVVLDAGQKGKERVLWKYMSPEFISGIDFDNKKSMTIKFSVDQEEIFNSAKSIDDFCKQLYEISENHRFMDKLNEGVLNESDARKLIKKTNEDICRYINNLNDGNSRDCVSGKILDRLMTLCSAVMMLLAIKRGGHAQVDEKLGWEMSWNDKESKNIASFFKLLKDVDPKIHIPDEGQAERLMLKYIDYLWDIRELLSDNFNMKVLDNLEEYPLNQDCIDEEYYASMASCIQNVGSKRGVMSEMRYYVYRLVPFYVGGNRYYEITLQLSSLYATKFNRVTVYSRERIDVRYSVQIEIVECPVLVLEIPSKIKVVTDWRVSIDPRCLNKLVKVLKHDFTLSSRYGEYQSLMQFLTWSRLTFLDVINLDDDEFQKCLNKIYGMVNTFLFKEVLIWLRQNFSFGKNNSGRHVIRYLLLNLKEKNIDAVLPIGDDDILNNCNCKISKRCFPFEKDPYRLSLPVVRTNWGLVPDIKEITRDDGDAYEYISPYLRIESMVGRTNEIYFEASEIGSNQEIDSYNGALDEWDRANGYLISEREGYVFREAYEQDVRYILTRILEMSKIRTNRSKDENKQFLERKQQLDEDIDEVKRKAIKKVFLNSHVLLIYGAAGTGKTTLISYISDLMSGSSKIFLTKTHTALNRIKGMLKDAGEGEDFITVDSFNKRDKFSNADVIFVDECNTIDNRSMKEFLKNVGDEQLMVLAGDINQIESIDYGNWFTYAKNLIVKEDVNVELTDNWRTKSEDLRKLWHIVRNNEDNIIETLTLDGAFSSNLSEEVFAELNEDEVVLCLNYDGKFGLNRINQYFQDANNKSDEYTWGEWVFKVGDPVVFVNNDRSDLLYNNLKGRIVDIVKTSNSITFDLDIDVVLEKSQCDTEIFEYISATDKKTTIRMEVIHDKEDFDDNGQRRMTVIPFQIAYAISIHKAQGLEYESVRLVIPRDMAESITSPIFYTAITRAKKNLKIYWSPETMKKVVENFSMERQGDFSLKILKGLIDNN